MICFNLQVTIAWPSMALLRTSPSKLRKFELDDGDWEVIDDLVLVLSVCYSLSCMVCDSHSPYHSYTKKQLFFFSSSKVPIMGIILTMDRLDRHLRPSSTVSYCAPIIAAMKLAKKKMDWYYSLTDDSSAYHIAMVLTLDSSSSTSGNMTGRVTGSRRPRI